MHVFTGVIAFLLVMVTVALIGLILVQRGKGGGLAGAFGGGGVEQAFGTRATTLAQKATGVLAGIYLLLSILLGLSLGMGHTSAAAAWPRPEAPVNAAPEKAPVPSVPSTPKDAK